MTAGRKTRNAGTFNCAAVSNGAERLQPRAQKFLAKGAGAVRTQTLAGRGGGTPLGLPAGQERRRDPPAQRITLAGSEESGQPGSPSTPCESGRGAAAALGRPPLAGRVPSSPLPSRRRRGGRGRASRSGPGSAAHGGERGAPPGPALPPRLRAGRLRDRPTPLGAARRRRRPRGPFLLVVRPRGDGGGSPRRSVVPAEPRRACGLHGRGRQHGAAVRRGGGARAAGAVPAAEGRLGAEQEPLRMEPPHASGQVREREGGLRAEVRVSHRHPASPRNVGLVGGSLGAGKGGRAAGALASPPPGCRGRSAPSLSEPRSPGRGRAPGSSGRASVGERAGAMLRAAVGWCRRSPGLSPGDRSGRLFPSLGQGEEGLSGVELAKCYPGALETFHVKDVVFEALHALPWFSQRKIGANVNTRHCSL